MRRHSVTRPLCIVICLTALVAACGEEKATTPEDRVPPAAVDDLTVSPLRGCGVTLSWTAPGDDGANGRASRYSVRFATDSITGARWDSAEALSSPPVPQPAGEFEEASVPNLSEGTWYFAVKAADDVPNWSALSNVVSATLSPAADTTAPAAIDDLSLVAIASDGATLSWTAPGDDGGVGRATTYDLRYAPAPITEKMWDEASEVGGEPLPGTSGVLESFALSGLASDSTYYVAIRAADEAMNWSLLSNVLELRTLRDSIPPSPIDDLAVASTTSSTATLGWTAGGDDGSEGQASAYDLRYALAMITDDSWDDATEVTGEPVPGPSGSAETLVVGDLDLTSTHYFALRVADEAANVSALSNNASAGPDTVPPRAVTNLAATSAGPSGVTLHWTTPGDDGQKGQASAYDIRYATVPITDESWPDATPAAHVPAPGAPGSAPYFSVMGLDVGVTYFFALRASDEVPNWSELSNIASETTVPLARLTTSPGGSRADYPAWSPGGQYIAVQADWGAGHAQVWIVPAAGGDPTRMVADEDYSWYPSWSPTGDRIAFMTHRWDGDPYEEDRSGLWVQPAVPLAPPTLIAEHGNGRFVRGSSWSPSGDRIVYAVDVEFQQSPFVEIMIVPSGGGATQLFMGDASNQWPAWSPDGTQIAFDSDRGGNRDIWVAPVDGGGPVQLTVDTARDSQPAWSPDGTRISFTSNRSGNDDIWVMSSTGGDLVQLTTSAVNDYSPVWSPDGRAIAFQSWRTGNSEIWVMAAEGK